MKLITKEILNTIPALYSQEEIELPEKMVYAKFFLFNFTWYVTECQIEEDGDILFFGYVKNDSDNYCSEWGYFVLSELESLQIKGIFKVERDLYFKPTKFSELVKTN